LKRSVVQRQGGPLAVTSEARSVTLGEEPLKAPEGARHWLALDQEQRLVGEGSAVADGELAGPGNEGGEELDVTRESVGDVEARAGDRVQSWPSLVDAEAAPQRAGRVGERALRGVDVGAHQHPSAQSLARDRFVAMEREVRRHLDAAPS